MSGSTEQLNGLDAATVHEAQGRRGALPSTIRPVVPGFRVVGPAFTVVSPPTDNLWIHRAVYAAAPGDVLVVGVGGGEPAGYWGEILSEAALARGLGGLVIDGGVRDTDRLAEQGFPVFSAGVSIRGTGKDPDGDGSLGETVRIGDVSVRPGDLVVGDADGVVVVPAADREQTIAAARARVNKERDVLDRLRAGETTLDILQLPQEQQR